MSSEKLCLKWNDFQENILSGFKDLRSDNEFTDVTLACEDGQNIAAHKVVLTTSSPLFMSLLKSNKHQHPLIYMRGMNYEDLVAIIDFLYCGEANVYQENLNAFLALADELKLKGLTGEGETKEDGSKKYPERDLQKEIFPPIKPTLHRKVQPVSEKGVLFESNYEKPFSLVKTTANAESDQIDEQVNSMIDSTEHFITRKSGQRKKAFICRVCEKEGEHTDMKRHIEAHHLTNVSYSCDICGKSSRSQNGLRQHTANAHGNRINVSGPEMA